MLIVRSQISYAVDTRKHWTAVMFSTTLYTVPVKTSTFFEYFSQKSANFYNVWLTHMVDTFSFCNFVFSEISVVVWCNNWLFKMHPIFEGNNENSITSIFHKVQW